MKIVFSDRAAVATADAPKAVRKALQKQLLFLERDLHYPSLRAKKYDDGRDIWQARVNRDWRFYFQIIDNMYIIKDVIPHPKVKRTAPWPVDGRPGRMDYFNLESPRYLPLGYRLSWPVNGNPTHPSFNEWDPQRLFTSVASLGRLSSPLEEHVNSLAKQ